MIYRSLFITTALIASGASFAAQAATTNKDPFLPDTFDNLAYQRDHPQSITGIALNKKYRYAPAAFVSSVGSNSYAINQVDSISAFRQSFGKPDSETSDKHTFREYFTNQAIVVQTINSPLTHNAAKINQTGKTEASNAIAIQTGSLNFSRIDQKDTITRTGFISQLGSNNIAGIKQTGGEGNVNANGETTQFSFLSGNATVIKTPNGIGGAIIVQGASQNLFGKNGDLERKFINSAKPNSNFGFLVPISENPTANDYFKAGTGTRSVLLGTRDSNLKFNPESTPADTDINPCADGSIDCTGDFAKDYKSSNFATSNKAEIAQTKVSYANEAIFQGGHLNKAAISSTNVVGALAKRTSDLTLPASLDRVGNVVNDGLTNASTIVQDGRLNNATITNTNVSFVNNQISNDRGSFTLPIEMNKNLRGSSIAQRANGNKATITVKGSTAKASSENGALILQTLEATTLDKKEYDANGVNISNESYNVADLTQQGNLNTTNFMQRGKRNTATIDQNGNYNYIAQKKDPKLLAGKLQTSKEAYEMRGLDNYLKVTQTGNYNSFVGANLTDKNNSGVGNKLELDDKSEGSVFGNNNSVTVIQKQTNAKALATEGNIADISILPASLFSSDGKPVIAEARPEHNTVYLEQIGAAKSVPTALSGANNDSVYIQGNNNYLSAFEKGNSNTLNAKIVGNNNGTNPNNILDSDKKRVEVNGDRNNTTFNQTGVLQNAQISVTGRANITNVSQENQLLSAATLLGNTALLSIKGNGNGTEITQTGDNNTGKLYVTGDKNQTTKIQQIGKNFSAKININGDDNIGTQITQIGEGSLEGASLTITGNRNSNTTFSQFGNNNKGTLTVLGNDNKTTSIVQTGNNHFASVSVNGDKNTTQVSQFSSTGLSENNNAILSVVGSSNNVTLEQDGSNNAFNLQVHGSNDFVKYTQVGNGLGSTSPITITGNKLGTKENPVGVTYTSAKR